MAIANNWEVLITRGIVSAPKTEIIVPPDPPKYEEPKRFAWLKNSIWTRAKVEIKGVDGDE
ncbi:hypothetical protein [Psychromonas sp. SR45-3]|uniref:hypothetical protein n=1 Tax=Psychromonas sp. SR45-3 TaxID=2760930 RepID=UPI0015FE7CFB|nr:hypothetical protein [Psychromonas sp. SR45-3]MBB1272544.1 hypothetical protein [Psychromonas sp. SR45-3]